MQNVTQQNPYHDKLAQILSQQVLADFDNFAKNLSMEETNEELVLHVRIPKSFLTKDIDKTPKSDKENFGSLYEVLKTLPKASYNEDPMTIQNKMREEWT